MDNIESLALQRKTDQVIKYLAGGDEYNQYKLLKITCYTKNIRVFKYMIENALLDLTLLDIFSYLYKEEFTEGLDYLAPQVPSAHLFLIVEILNKVLPLPEEVLLKENLNYAMITHPEILRQLLLDYHRLPEIKQHRDIIQSSPPEIKDKILYQSSADIMNNAVYQSITTGGPTFKLEEFKAYRAKNALTVSKKDKTAKTIWAQYLGRVE